MKSQLTEAQIQRNRKGGRASCFVLKQKYGEDYFYRLGRKGGRPTHAEEVAKAHRRREEALQRAQQTARGAKQKGDGTGNAPVTTQISRFNEGLVMSTIPNGAIRFKACGRCKGDLSFDSYHNEWNCVQCSKSYGDAANARPYSAWSYSLQHTAVNPGTKLEVPIA